MERDVVRADFQRLLPNPDQIGELQVRFHPLLKNGRHIPHLVHIGQLKGLLGDGLQKGLLGVNAADIGGSIAGAVVVLPPADHLQGLLAVQMAGPGVKMDVQVLVVVVVIHIHRDIEVHAVNGVHQLHKGPQVHGDIVVNGDAQQLGDLLHGLRKAAVVVGVVQLFHRPGHIEQGVPWKADDVHRPAIAVQGQQQVGVAAAVLVVKTAQKDGVEVLLSGGEGGGGPGVAAGLLGCVGRFLLQIRACGDSGFLGKAFIEPHQGGENKQCAERHHGYSLQRRRMSFVTVHGVFAPWRRAMPAGNRRRPTAAAVLL